VSKTYQKSGRGGQPASPVPSGITVPEQVVVSMAEIAESAREGLLALAVSTGLQVMTAMFAEDVGRLCGLEGKHNADRAGYRHGSGAGSVTLGGRRIPVARPRVRSADGSGELHLPSYDLFSSTEILGQMAMEKMLAGLSSRRYSAGLEPAGQAVEEAAASTSRSTVSRRFVAATETALAELMTRQLDDLDPVALMIDGVHFGEHTCVVALGIGIDGVKHPLAVEEGSTENATLVTGLRGRGLDVTRPILAVLDPGPHAPLDQPDRVDDRDLPGTLQERQAVAGRNHGAALVRRRHARSRPSVPPRQRPPAPAQAPRRARSALHRECQPRKPQ
jgi:putative transposase